ncbi:MAG: transcriptional regulator, AbrB family [Herbinix sp.]|nr:transcriptional regulator, AbrB family [Herbinix sp.]
MVKADDKFRGIARELDGLGRLCLPIEARRSLAFNDRQEVDMYIEGEKICIRKEGKVCAVCGRTGELFDLYPVKEVHICKSCALAVTDMVMEKGL